MLATSASARVMLRSAFPGRISGLVTMKCPSFQKPSPMVPTPGRRPLQF